MAKRVAQVKETVEIYRTGCPSALPAVVRAQGSVEDNGRKSCALQRGFIRAQTYLAVFQIRPMPR